MFKLRSILLLAAFAAAALMFTSCDKDDTDLTKGSIALTVAGLPSGAAGNVVVTGPSSFSKTVTATETLTDLAVGTYTLTVGDATTSSGPYSAKAGEKTVTVTVTGGQTAVTTVTYAFKGHEFGIEGEWISQGDSVCTILSFYFAVDSIYAKFNADQTYLVESFDTAGVKTTYTGTYTQTKSGTGNIFDIVISQSTPSAATSEGILEVYPGAPNTMKYEIVQTAPTAAGIPPTATGGFGSTSAGAYGTTNIQKYRRVK